MGLGGWAVCGSFVDAGYHSPTTQKSVQSQLGRASGLASSDQQLPPTVRLKQGMNSKGKRIHYYLNYSSAPAIFKYGYAAATDLLTGNQLSKGALVKVGPWDLVIAEESAPSE